MSYSTLPNDAIIDNNNLQDGITNNYLVAKTIIPSDSKALNSETIKTLVYLDETLLPSTDKQLVRKQYLANHTCCASGYTITDDYSQCYKIDQHDATLSGGGGIELQHYVYDQYSYWGTIIYPYGTYNTHGVPSIKPNTTLINTTSPLYGGKPSGEASVINSLWCNTTSGTAMDGSNGRLNRCGIWKQGYQTYNTTNIGFSRQIIVPSTQNYLIGVGSDDNCIITVNGVNIITQVLTEINSAFNTLYGGTVGSTADLYRYWHIYEIQLNVGPNIISINGNNSTSIGIVGCEIYNATINQLLTCTNETQLTTYILFSSAAPTFGTIANGDISDTGSYNCYAYPGYQLVNDNGTYYCRKNEYLSVQNC